MSRNGTVSFSFEDAACPVADTLYYDGPWHSLKGSRPTTVSSKAANTCMMEFSAEDANTPVTSTSQLDLVLPSPLLGNGTSTSANETARHCLSKGGIIALAFLGGLFRLLGLVTFLFCFRYRINALFRREKKRDENQPRKQRGVDMDIFNIIRNSYHRQYERYRSYRQSKDTVAATVVGNLGGKVDEDREPVENKPIPPSPRDPLGDLVQDV